MAALLPEVTCSVCLELVSDTRERSIAKLKCGHSFHLDCIGSAFNAKGSMQCPNCRGIEHGDWLYGKGCPHPELLIFDQPADDLESSTDWEVYSDDLEDFLAYNLRYVFGNEDDFSLSSVIDSRSNQESATRQRLDYPLGIEDLFCGEDVWNTRDVLIRREDVLIGTEEVLMKRQDVLIGTEDVVWLRWPSPYAHAQAPVLDWCARNDRVREWAANLSCIQVTSAYQAHFMMFLGKLPNWRYVPIRREDLMKREDVLIRTEDVVWLGEPSPYWCARNERVRHWADFMLFSEKLPNIRPSGFTFEKCTRKLMKEMRASKKFGHDPFKLEGRKLASSALSIRRYPFNSQGQSGHPHHLHSGKIGHPYNLHLACLVHMCCKLQAQSKKEPTSSLQKILRSITRKIDVFDVGARAHILPMSPMKQQ